MTDLEREAREAAEVYRVACGLGTVGSGQLTHEAIGYAQGFYDAAAPREQELRRLRLLAEEQLTTLRKLKAEMLSDTRDQEIERLRARVVEVTAQRDAFMDSREEVVALRASLVQQAHDYRAQVVFWGDNADQRTAEVASLRARVEELKGMVPMWVPVAQKIALDIQGWLPLDDQKCGDDERLWLMVPPIPLPETKEGEGGR